MAVQNKTVLYKVHFLWLLGIVLTVIFIAAYPSSVSQNIQNGNFGFTTIHKIFQGVSKTRVFFIMGSQQDVLKLAPVIHEFKTSGHFNVLTVLIGGKDDRGQSLFDSFDLSRDIKVDIDNPSILSRDLIVAIEKRVESLPSDIWMVQGGSVTSYASAFVAFNRKLRIGHVEAGIRSYNMYSPFPQEFHRKFISNIATFHFAPTTKSKMNLLKEGVPNDRIFQTGSTIIDAFNYLKRKSFDDVNFGKYGITSEHTIVLLAVSREDNVARLPQIYNILNSVSCLKCQFLISIDYDQANTTTTNNSLCTIGSNRLKCLSNKMKYNELFPIIRQSQFVIIDSAELQEVATLYKKPTLALNMNYTGQSETGTVTLVGQDLNKLKLLTSALIDKNSATYKQMSTTEVKYRTLNPSKEILQALVENEKLFQNSLKMSPAMPVQPRPVGGVAVDPKIKTPTGTSVGLVLQVYQRQSLKMQLDNAVIQTLKPSTIVIVQNGFYVDVSGIIKKFRQDHPEVEVQHIASSRNLRYHGRFHIAYMLTEDYVSVWDDDIMPRRDWIRYCVEYSRAHGNALVGGNGRTFERIDTNTVRQNELIGRNDFVGHSWTLMRILLKYYIEMEPFTLHTGEDIQLSYALQKVGIESHKPPQSGDKAAPDEMRFTNDKSASFSKKQSPRFLLFCKVLKAGFKPLQCSNCADMTVLNSCIQRYEKDAALVEGKAKEADKNYNNRIIWRGV